MTISRRLFSFGAASIAAAPAASVVAGTAAAQTATDTASLQGAGFYRVPLGDLTLTVIADGNTVFPGAPLFAPRQAELFEGVQRSLLSATDTMNAHFNIALVEVGGRRILVDAGAGPFLGADLGRTALGLRNAGIDPASIDTVAITHGHADHFGGLTDADGRPAFPNASIVWREGEYRHWLENAASAWRSTPLPPSVADTFIAANDVVLPAIAPQLELVNGAHELAPGVMFLEAPGHTPHSSVVLVTSGEEGVLVASDTLLLPIHNARHPEMISAFEWTSTYEADPDVLVATRRRYLNQAASEGLGWLGYHASFPAMGGIRREGDAFEFVAKSWNW